MIKLIINNNLFDVKCPMNDKDISNGMMGKKFDLLVTFGGYDANNILDKLCYELENYLPKLKVKIIIGPSTKKTKYFKHIESDIRKEFTYEKVEVGTEIIIFSYPSNLEELLLKSGVNSASFCFPKPQKGFLSL